MGSETVQTVYGPVQLGTGPVQTDRPVVPLDEFYIETPFARRTRDLFDEARANRSWHVASGLSGAGKSTETGEYQDGHPVDRRPSGVTHAPVLVANPSTDARSSVAALQLSLIENFGTVPHKPFGEARGWLINEMTRCETELVIIDDGHGLLAPDLLYVKQLTDEVTKRQKGRRVGLVIVCMATEGKVPLAEIINRDTEQWVQFRKRMSTSERPWCHIASLSADEVKDVLVGYERGILREIFPDLHLWKWSSRIHRHLTHPFFQQDRGERVPMQNVRNVVDGIIRRLAARGLGDIPGETLIDEVVAAMLVSNETKLIEHDPATARLVSAVATGTGR